MSVRISLPPFALPKNMAADLDLTAVIIALVAGSCGNYRPGGRVSERSSVLLLPAKLLNDLPVLNSDAWFHSSINAEVRNQMNIEVGRRVPKSKIVEIARQRPESIRGWACHQTSRRDLAGYDYGGDPRGVVGWESAPREFA